MQQLGRVPVAQSTARNAALFMRRADTCRGVQGRVRCTPTRITLGRLRAGILAYSARPTAHRQAQTLEDTHEGSLDMR